MTNRQYVINQLVNGRGGASYKAMLYYNFNCPYIGRESEGGLCYDEDIEVCIKKATRETCVKCIEKWLDSERNK